MKLKKLLPLGLLVVSVLGCKFSASSHSSDLTENSASQINRETPVSNLNADEPNAEATPKPTAKKQLANAVCPDPEKPCQHRDKHFDEWELPFKMPAKLQANKPYESAPFYAVILKTYDLAQDCDGGEFIEAAESDRKNEQENHKERKVFASYECPNMSAVNYDFEGRWNAKKEQVVLGNFIAVYAGETREEAEEILREVKSRFPKAMLKQMKASFEVIEQ